MSTVTSPWDMETRKGGGEGGGFEVCPAGNFPATLVGLFDVGHLPAVKKDGTNFERHEMVLVFELTKKDAAGKPFVMANSYTMSMHEKATFYAIACNLMGKKFADGERFNALGLLGKPCMVQVTNSTVTKNGKDRTYANVGAITSFPEEFPAIKPTRDPVVWTVASGTAPPDTSWVPFIYGKSVKDMVQMSNEYKTGQVPTLGGGTAVNAAVSDDADVPW